LTAGCGRGGETLLTGTAAGRCGVGALTGGAAVLGRWGGGADVAADGLAGAGERSAVALFFSKHFGHNAKSSAALPDEA